MRAIPSSGGIPIETRKSIDALKENMEDLRAMRGDKIAILATTATTGQIISKINEIIVRLQG